MVHILLNVEPRSGGGQSGFRFDYRQVLDGPRHLKSR